MKSASGRIYISFFLFLLLFRADISFSQMKKSMIGSSSSKVFVNIDSPNFRRINVVVPEFIIESGSQDPTLRAFAKSGRKELISLLRYSGIFNVMDDAIWVDVMAKLKKNLSKQGSPFGISEKDQMKNVNIEAWRAFGVESLNIGRLRKTGQRVVLESWSFDAARGKTLVAKGFTTGNRIDQTKAVRRWADLILKAYTGKSGVFFSKITFIGKRTAKSEKQVFVCDFDGTNLRQVTRAKAIHVSPHFSPDGRYITFTSYEQGNPDLYAYDLVNNRKKKLSSYRGLNSGATWSPNGRFITYTGSVNGDSNIYTIPKSGGARKILIRGRGLDVDPLISPDKKYIAFVSGRYGNPHIFRGTLMWLSESEVRVVSDKRLTYAGWYNATPDWSPDSKNIIFAGYDKDIDRFDIFTMEHDGRKLERLTLKAGDNESPAWAPNGQMVVFQSNRIGYQNRKGRPALYLMFRDGSHQRKLDIDLYEAQTPSWSKNNY